MNQLEALIQNRCRAIGENAVAFVMGRRRGSAGARDNAACSTLVACTIQRGLCGDGDPAGRAGGDICEAGTHAARAYSSHGARYATPCRRVWEQRQLFPERRVTDQLVWLVPFWVAGVLVFYMRGAMSWMAARRLRLTAFAVRPMCGRSA